MTTVSPAPVGFWPQSSLAPLLPHRLPSPRWDPAYDDEATTPEGAAAVTVTRGSLALADPLPLQLSAVARPRPRLRAVPSPADPVDPPGPRAVSLIRALLEVMAGGRSPRSIAAVSTLELQPQLGDLVPRRKDISATWARSLRSLRVTEPAPGVAEVTAVIEQGPRFAALAMRMEFRSGQWILTALEYC